MASAKFPPPADWAPPAAVAMWRRARKGSQGAMPADQRIENDMAARLRPLFTDERMRTAWEYVQKKADKHAIDRKAATRAVFAACVRALSPPASAADADAAWADVLGDSFNAPTMPSAAEVKHSVETLARLLAPWANGKTTDYGPAREILAALAAGPEDSTRVAEAFQKLAATNAAAIDAGRADDSAEIRFAVRTLVAELFDLFDSPCHVVVIAIVETLFEMTLTKCLLSRMAKASRDVYGNVVVESAR